MSNRFWQAAGNWRFPAEPMLGADAERGGRPSHVLSVIVATRNGNR